jgi:hypothetical protein
VVKLGTQSVIGALSFWILRQKTLIIFSAINFNIILSLQIFIAHCLSQIALLARNLLNKLRIFEVSFIFQYLKGLPRAHSPKVHSKIKKPLPVALDW